MPVSVVCLQEVKVSTCFIHLAFPAAFEIFVLAAIPDFTGRRASTVSAAFGAPEFHHQPECIVAFLVILKCTPEGQCRDCLCKFFVVNPAELFSQIPCQIRNFLGMSVAIKATEPAVRYDLFCIHMQRLYFPKKIPVVRGVKM